MEFLILNLNGILALHSTLHLSNYNIGIEKSVNYGWGIFGWINKYIFIPLFNFISSFMPFGISIIIMTIIV